MYTNYVEAIDIPKCPDCLLCILVFGGVSCIYFVCENPTIVANIHHSMECAQNGK